MAEEPLLTTLATATECAPVPAYDHDVATELKENVLPVVEDLVTDPPDPAPNLQENVLPVVQDIVTDPPDPAPNLKYVRQAERSGALPHRSSSTITC